MPAFGIEDENGQIQYFGSPEQMQLNPDQRLQNLTPDEADLMVRVPSINVKDFETKTRQSKVILFGKALGDNIANTFIDTPADMMMLIGQKHLEEQGVDKDAGTNWQIGIAKQFRNMSVALRSAIGVEPEGLQPESYGEAIVTGLPGIGTSFAAVSAGRAVGAIADKAAVPLLTKVAQKIAMPALKQAVLKYGPKLGMKALLHAPTPLTVVAGYGVSYAMEKAQLSKDLTDFGYSAHQADFISNVYAVPAAAIDYLSFGVLSQSFRKLAGQAIQTTIKKSAGTWISQVVKEAGKGFVSEGTTEAIQQAFETQTRISSGLQSPEFLKDAEDLSLAFIIGGLGGGSISAAGQLAIRSRLIDIVKTHTMLQHPRAVQLVDDMLARGFELALSEIQTKADISDTMLEINNAFEQVNKRGVMDELGFVARSERAQTELEIGSLVANVEDIIATKGVQELRAQQRQTISERVEAQKEIDLLNKAKETLRQAPEQAFKQEMGRDAKPEELSTWQASQAKKLQAKEQALQAKWATINDKLANTADRIQAENTAAYPKQIEKLMAKRNFIQDRIERLNDSLTTANPKQAQNIRKELADLLTRVETLNDTIMNLDSKAEVLAGLKEKFEVRNRELEGIHKEISDIENKLNFLFQDPLNFFQQEKGRLPKAGELTIWVKEQEARYAELLKKSDVLADEYFARERLITEIQERRNQYEGKVGFTPTELRNKAKIELKNILDSVKSGYAVAIKDVKQVKKLFLDLLNQVDLKPSERAKFFRMAFSITTPQDFNSRIIPFVDKINQLIDADKAQQYRDIVKTFMYNAAYPQSLEDKRAVSPDMQRFYQHLIKVYNGDVEVSPNTEAVDPLELKKALMEQDVIMLRDSGGDSAVAKGAAERLTQDYEYVLQKYQDQLAQREAFFGEKVTTLLTGLTGIDKKDLVNEMARYAEKKDQKASFWSSFIPTPMFTSFMTVLNSVDMKAGYGFEQGPLFTLFDGKKPYFNKLHNIAFTKRMIDDATRQIYGQREDLVWAKHKVDKFIDMPYYTADGQIKMTPLSRSTAMTLRLLLDMPNIKNDIIKMGISPSWIEAFHDGSMNVFSAQDIAFFQHARTFYDQWYEKIAPVYERVKGKALPKIENYMTVMRYMYRDTDVLGPMESSNIIEQMLGKELDSKNVESNRLKSRNPTELGLVLPHLCDVMAAYGRDMSHFVAYAEYAVALDKIFNNVNVRNVLKDKLPPSALWTIDSLLETVVKGSFGDTKEAPVLRGLNTLLGFKISNLLFKAKQVLTQLTSVGAAVGYQVPGGPLTIKDILTAATDIVPATIQGRAKNLQGLEYIVQRNSGLFDFGVAHSQAIADAFAKSDVANIPVMKPLARAAASKRLAMIKSLFTRAGDMAASNIVGWAAYKKALKATGNEEIALRTAIDIIDDTQGTMDPTRVPMPYNNRSFFARMFTVLNRVPGIYCDQYIRTWEGFVKGKIDNKQFVRKMMTYHIWLPLFETMAVSFSADWRDLLTNMVAGPMASALIIGNFIQSIVAAVIEKASGSSVAEMYRRADNRVMSDSILGDIKKAFDYVIEYAEQPDIEEIYSLFKVTGKAAEVTPFPTYVPLQQTQGIFELLMSDDVYGRLDGFKRLAGYSDYIIEQAQ